MHTHADPASDRHSTPRIEIDLEAIRENAAAVTSRFDGRIVGVVKGVTGHPAIAQAMLDGGVVGVADSRVSNLARVGEALDTERTLLRVMQGEREAIIPNAERSLHTEPAVVEALGRAAEAQGEHHEVILMVDMGDRREGVMPADTPGVLEQIVDTPGISVVGLGTNAGCFGGVVPGREMMDRFVDIVEIAEETLGREFSVLSGGSTVNLPLVEEGTLPSRVNELRIGEGILLGTNVTSDRTIDYLRQDAFTIHAEVIECKKKPSMPEGTQGLGANGKKPEFEDRGVHDRAIVALGLQDTVPNELTPIDHGVEILGASSDHLVCDVTETEVAVGDTLAFKPGYHALVGAFTPQYVSEVVRE